MARWKKYRLAKPVKRSGNGLDRLLAVVVLATLVGVVWYYSRGKEPGGRHPAKTVTANPHARAKAALPLKAADRIVRVAGDSLRNAPPRADLAPVVQRPAEIVPVAVTNGGTPPAPVATGRRPQNPLEAQIALARQGISCGPLDGAIGSQTRAALRAFQRKLHLLETGALDTNTRPALALASPPFTNYAVTSNDLARLQPLSKTWLGKSQQSALEYENVLELVAEKSQANPKLIKLLNPGLDWTNVPAGTSVSVPDVARPEPAAKAAFVIISLSEKTLEAFDAETNLLAHFPCSIARRVEKRPAGELHVTAVAPNPNYTFDPEIFPEVPEARTITNKLILQPGPNNPVGTVWISLDLPGYGIHGTPKPEEVGRTESHGCFRLANWNAEHLLKLVWIGLPVRVEP
jgi:lipoprotein-anchoring transpeptidase ErfK/SrfK